ncbi:MAG: hypothetical protein M1511_15855 [Deltaproteobacteria bacterium]|nr:hypothetical protein [Deltaproteobacteria bacterium]
MTKDFRLDDFLPMKTVNQTQNNAKVKPQRSLDLDKYFIQGPISLNWISSASKAPGRVLQVALALWHLSCLTKSPKVKMQRKWREVFGFSEKAYRHALRVLESNGLVNVERLSGQSSNVTVILRENSENNL